jgi:alpha-beta hydrolase superfamily lysophospholipase
VWLGGFGSDMRGIKASFLDRIGAASGLAVLRFDYSGHGESGGRFEDGTIGLWLEEALAALGCLTQGPQVIVGSSMGAWLALLVARVLQARGEGARLAGLVLLAPAVDFTEKLLWERMGPQARAELEKAGTWRRRSAYSADPAPITKELIEEGRRHLLLGSTIRTYCPVHIIQGMADDDVPWQHATTLVEHLAGDPVTLTLVKDGDHRLSRAEDLARLEVAVEAIIAAACRPEEARITPTA